MANLLSLTDVSKKLDIEIQTIKYYMQEGFIEVQKDDVTDALLIDEKNLELLGNVILLRECNVPFSEVKQVMKAYNEHSLKVLLKRALDEIEQEIENLERIRLQVKNKLRE